jgi:hypothetical protein
VATSDGLERHPGQRSDGAVAVARRDYVVMDAVQTIGDTSWFYDGNVAVIVVAV